MRVAIDHRRYVWVVAYDSWVLRGQIGLDSCAGCDPLKDPFTILGSTSLKKVLYRVVPSGPALSMDSMASWMVTNIDCRCRAICSDL